MPNKIKNITRIIGLLFAAYIIFEFATHLLVWAFSYNQDVKVVPVDTSIKSERLLEPTVQIGTKASFNVEIADTTSERVKGLSGRESILDYEGMLFIFPVTDYYGFWMKGMKFDLDMIFIKDDKVVDIARNLSSDPARQYEVVRPIEKADIVLEIKAGLADVYKIKVGDMVYYKNLKLEN